MITVLCLLSLLSIISATIVTLSQSSLALTYAFTDYEKTMLISDGAASRIYWLIAYDRILHPERIIAVDKSESAGEYIADGTEHIIDYYGCPVSFTISDMMSGIDISGFNPSGNFDKNTNGTVPDENDQQLITFKNRLMDYIDIDSLTRLDGMEKNDYLSLEIYNLPRNNRLQYREEILYIPGSKNYFPIDEFGRLSSARIVIPQQISYSNPNTQINIFNMDGEQISSKFKTSEDETKLILEAINLWQKSKIPLRDSLPLEVFSKIKDTSSVRESGFYSITIKAASQNNRQGRMLSVSMYVSPLISPQGISVYEWTFY